ncbi:Carboxymethylenebutenolidase-like protein [Microtus ochrogaster]|uniref:Carboxymethylenebutenolidase homolog n=1 Tax=Microtus ochrogaster TaxID=79684 RepID=A0A8J6GB31_MICOH|nr:Carboxymethylenebutenolidase-like protein [Microtus ochrogaster]
MAAGEEEVSGPIGESCAALGHGNRGSVPWTCGVCHGTKERGSPGGEHRNRATGQRPPASLGSDFPPEYRSPGLPVTASTSRAGRGSSLPLHVPPLAISSRVSVSRCLPLSSPPDKPDIKTPMANEANPCPCDIGHKLEYGGMGQEVQVEHIKAYITKSPEDTGKAVIVVQDIYGWQLPNTRYMADMIAGNGYTTIVPDFFVGREPWDPAADWSTFPEWIKSRSAREVNREVEAVLRYLKQKCHAQKIGIVGFCWGGAVVHHVMLRYPEVRAGVSVYGIIKDSEDVYNLKNPTLFIFAENDAVIPLEQVSVLTQKLKKHCIVNYQVKTFSGQTHGFVHRKREDCSPADKPYIEEARRNLIEWFNKYM